jgi:hypothetical protein
MQNLSEYERGVVDALTEVAWEEGEDVVWRLEYSGADIPQWNALVRLALENRKCEFEEIMEDA